MRVVRDNETNDSALMDRINDRINEMNRPKHDVSWMPTWIYKIFAFFGIVKTRVERRQSPPTEEVVGQTVYYKTLNGMKRPVGTIVSHDPETKRMDFAPLKGKSVSKRSKLIRGKKLFAMIDGEERFLGVGTR